ncbi:RNA polymerase sigma factor [Neobacillus terrae]|uniref:RNA polymerase sigma factor n=1 Tax=Neobacillus terrae TaxID=3034837 RepID=UPI0014099B50|nr:RNA polymerase sigma factor [Neobacillus terrae]NHM33130.1 RNA polymerase sigma factor [Neobacillus terrae]
MEASEQIEQWFYKYEKDITNYLVYYTGSRDVEDMVQETFLRAFKGFNHFRHNSNHKTWLISIARNTAADSFRKKGILQKIKTRLLEQPEMRIQPRTEDSILWKNDLAELYKSINQLKPNYRDVVLLRGIAELSSEETAEVLGWTANKVNVTFFRACKKLNENLKGSEEFGQSIG